MLKRSFKYPILLLLFCLFSVSASAQNRKALEQKRKELGKKIEYTNKLINNTSSEKKKEENRLKLLSKKVQFRTEILNTLKEEVNLADKKLAELQQSLANQEKELNTLQNEYEQLILKSYKTRNRNGKLMFIFSSQNFYQAYRRLVYLNEYAEYRKKQGEKILLQKQKVEEGILALQEAKSEKENLLVSQKEENIKLGEDLNKQKESIQSLQTKEKELRKQLRKQQAEKDKINDLIKDLIAKELSKNKSKSGGSFKLTPEAKLLSEDFISNKGKLPAPVQRGIITGKFGKQPHPAISGVYIDNKGITYTTEENAFVRSIFKGTVSNVLVIPGAGKVVIINHGAYRSVYTNMKDVIVSKGDKVDTKEDLGTLLSKGKGKSEAHIEIWQISGSGTQNLNPSQWIYN